MHLGGRNGGTFFVKVRGNCTVNGSLGGVGGCGRVKIGCVALYRSCSGSVYRSSARARSTARKLARFNHRMIGRVGQLNVVVSVSRTDRNAF